MNCQHWKPILFDLARGLNNDQAREALMHAQECRQCAIEVEEQRALNMKLKLLAADANQQDAQNIPAVLLTAFRERQSSAKRNQHVLIWARAAVLIVAILGGWFWYRSMDHRVNPANTDVHAAQNDDEFILLQYGNPAVNSMQVVRVELESSALQELGFPRVPEWEDRPIQADIVVGEDGLPQAIRFVNLKQH